jgi:hypothetical protein
VDEDPGGYVQRSRPTQNKRARERARQERQQQKAARRLEAKSRKVTTPGAPGDEDPDIAGIVPGPQPSPWGDEDEAVDAETDTDSDTDSDQNA